MLHMRSFKMLLPAILVGTFVVTAVGVSAAAEMGVTNDTILIGALAPLTGVMTTSGMPARDGAQTYFYIINDSGSINGRKLKVIWEDDGCAPAKGIAAILPYHLQF